MLIIEKVIKLLDDFHYSEFRNYVKNLSKRSFYPLALFDAIKRDFSTNQDIEQLMFAVYGEKDEKTRKKFLQLAHYTFKLTAFLANNYPHYLQSNLTKFQSLVNKEDLQKANLLADILFEIVRKVEDFSTELQLLKMQTQQNFLLDSSYFSVKLSERIRTLLVYETDLNVLMNHVFETFSTKTKKSLAHLENHLKFFQNYQNHESTALRLISQYYQVYSFYYLKHEQFYDAHTFGLLNKLEHDFQKNEFVLLPYLNDYRHNIAFLKLNHQLHHSSEEVVVKSATKMMEEGERQLYWKSFVNIPELTSIEIQVAFYAKKYMRSYRNIDHPIIPIEVFRSIELLKERCEKLLENDLLQQMFIVQFIRLHTTYARLLICGNKANQQKAIFNLESILLSYQQFSFHDWLAPIYAILAMANLNLAQHDKVEEICKRYRRVFSNRTTNPENELTIYAFYYIAKWLETSRNQYLQKLENVLNSLNRPNLIPLKELILDLSKFYKIPIKV